MFEKETIGKNLNRIRENRGWTIEELAEMVNYSPRSVSDHVKKGISSVDTILHYSRVMGCKPADFFKE